MSDEAAKVRVLLLEDSAIDAELVSSNLENGRDVYSIRWVSDRQSYSDALAGGEFDVILADYSLPDFDGLSALNLARMSSPQVPFIFVSGIVGEEFATNAITRGATDYVVKRNLSRLPAAIERAVAESRERAARLQAQEALKTLNATLADQIEARTQERDRIWRLSRDLFTVADRTGHLISVNPAWWRILGHDENELHEQSFRGLTHADDLATMDTMLSLVASGEPADQIEFRMRRRGGDYRWLSWTAIPHGPEFYAIGRDITESKQAAADIAEANANLTAEIAERERVEATLRRMQRLEAVGQLTSGVAHDFNNLLSVILGNVGFAEREAARRQADPKEVQRLQHIRAAADRGARLTAQLLAFSRRQRLEPRAVDMNETVTGMHDLLQSSMGGAVEFETRLNASLWPALVDRTQIEMVVLNLVINARDAMEGGGTITIQTDNVTLDVSDRPDDPSPGEYVLLMVRDTGSGMSADVLAKAFEPFFTTKGPGRGSGLGLAQVYGFAKQSGGGVRIDTAAGRGTAVCVYLPRALDVPDPAPAPPAAPVRAATALAADVLLVDDDSAVRAVTASILAESGFNVIEAASGSAALEVIQCEKVDLLLVDYAMPGMNGAETAAAAVKLCPGLPVVYITGYADLASLRDVREDHIIQKPYRDDELRQKLDAALARAANSARPDAR